MSKRAVWGLRESTEDVLDYVKFAGFELTRDQLMRLHQRRLIGQNFHISGLRRFIGALNPPGTAERMLRIARLKATTKKLDELGWRLWWEGSEVEPELVREYLVKIATRWDVRLGEIHNPTTTDVPVEEELGERDILDEVFFQKPNATPSMASVRKRLGKGTDLYVEFAGLLVDLMRGDFSTLSASSISLFAEDDVSPSEVHETALRAMRSAMTQPFAELVASLDDEQIENARPVALLLSRIIASIGDIVNDAYGGGTRDTAAVGKSLVALSENPEEQVLSLLLTTSFLKDEHLREHLPEFEEIDLHVPAISFLDYLRLEFLASEVPGLERLMTPARIHAAFESLEGAERWRTLFDQFRVEHFDEVEDAMASRPDLFGSEPLEEEDGDEEDEEKVNSKKKNLKTSPSEAPLEARVSLSGVAPQALWNVLSALRQLQKFYFPLASDE